MVIVKMTTVQLTFGTIVILFHIHSAVSEPFDPPTIDDIRLRPVDTNSINEGIVLIKSQNEWYGVCYHHWTNGKTIHGKTWGVKEASAACIQLGFKKGWPTEVHLNASKVADKFIVDFDCDSREIHLRNCVSVTSITNSCKHSRPAGVHCYNDFSVHLNGGAAPNAGRVEVKYDDTWASVCFESEQDVGPRPWRFDDAEVVCKELGFPGTMFSKQGGLGQGTHKTTIYGYSCKSNIVSLSECLQNRPDILPDTFNGPSCRKNNEAVVICAVPGYIGCFATYSGTMGDAEWTSHELRLEANDMTIGMCRHHCNDIGLQLACLFNGRKCLCRDSVGDHIRVENHRCETRCSGGDLEACGGADTMSVYNVNLGICDDPLTGTDIFYYGDNFNNFSCTDGRQLEGPKSVQCVMHASGYTQWNDGFPICKERLSCQQWTINKLALVLGVPGGCFIIIVIMVVFSCKAVSMYQRNGNSTRPTNDVSQAPDTDVDHDEAGYEDIDETSIYLTASPGPGVHLDSTTRHGHLYDDVYEASMRINANRRLTYPEYASNIAMVPGANEAPNSQGNASGEDTFHGARVVLHTYLHFTEDNHVN